MPRKSIFCNTPWFEAHIYWDGSFGLCCQEAHKLYDDNKSSHYNIKTMSLQDWMNTDPARTFRSSMLASTPSTVCTRCYTEEKHAGTSKRLRSNQKSVIFTKSAFDESFKQSPHINKFNYSKNNNGSTTTFPVDIHVDLGNYCNLACKMCWPGASSRIATHYKNWGLVANNKAVDWTKDNEVWERFLNELLTIPNLRNIHLMGGETAIAPRFAELINFLDEHKRYDVGISFVTNGTRVNHNVMKTLTKFNNVTVEVSIETLTKHNEYIRQGTINQVVLDNIKVYQQYIKSVTIRPAISLLSVGTYYTLLRYCLTNKLIIKSLLVTAPEYLDIAALPINIRQGYMQEYNDLLSELDNNTINKDFNESNTDNYRLSVLQQVKQIISCLNADQKPNSNELLKEMVGWCKRWDKQYRLDAKTLYPEFKEILEKYEY